MSSTAWLDLLTHEDWLWNGRRCTLKQWKSLDWSKAYMDLGPSPAGNTGPYWHVPTRDGDAVHRLYPRLLQTKWAGLVQQVAQETKKCLNDERPVNPPPA